MSRPMLLLDVDGVLNVIGPDYKRRLVKLKPDDHPFSPNPHSLDFLKWAWARFDVVWCTCWRRDANKIARWAGLPEAPVLVESDKYKQRLRAMKPPKAGAPWDDQADWKIAAVKEVLGRHEGAIVWIEDGISREAKEWVAKRPRTWYFATDGFEGVTPAHMRNIEAVLAEDPR